MNDTSSSSVINPSLRASGVKRFAQGTNAKHENGFFEGKYVLLVGKTKFLKIKGNHDES